MKNEEIVKIVKDAMIKLHERRIDIQRSHEVMKISSEVKVKTRSPQNKSFRSSGLEFIRE